MSYETESERASTGKLIIRVDASAEQGTGHLMRCIALAQAWGDAEGSVRIVAAQIPESLADRVRDEGFELETIERVPGSQTDADTLADIAERQDAAAIVIDGYHFRDEFLVAVRRGTSRALLLIDDWGQSRELPVDLVVNQNPPPWPEQYRSAETMTLTGTEWAMLRREFLSEEPQGGSRDQILVTFGGSDVLGLTPSISRELSKMAAVTVVIGAAARSLPALQEIVALNPEIRVLTNVRDMAQVMKQARIAVTASGSTCWELCYFGVPIVAVPVAANQQPIASYLEAQGAGRRVLPTDEDDTAAACATVVQELLKSPEEQQRLAANARALVDGGGAARIVRELLLLADSRK